MPANDFAPGAGPVDPAKTYLIKGKTLADLLKKTTFSPEDFDVQESSTGRVVRVRQRSSIGASCNVELLDVELSVTESGGVYYAGVNKATEPIVLAIRNGMLVADPGEFTGTYDTIPTYRVISRLRGNNPSSSDTGAIHEGPDLG